MEDDSQQDEDLSEYPDDFTENEAKVSHRNGEQSLDSSREEEEDIEIPSKHFARSALKKQVNGNEDMSVLSRKLVAENERNIELSRALAEAKSERDALVREAEAARAKLLSGQDEIDDRHATLAQLIVRREKALSEGHSLDKYASSEIDRCDEKTLRVRLRRTDEELSKTKDELAKRKIAMLQRGRADKDSRAKVEQEAKLAAKKVSALSDHVEKLMVHLKHEVASKVSSQDQLRKAEKEIEALRHRNTILLNRNNAREQLLLELREGSKILEDQLRLMDRRYLDLRAKLDWTRQHADREVKKAKATASTLRAKWAAYANSDQEHILLDDVAVDRMKKPRTVDTPAVRTRRERPRTGNPLKAHKASTMRTNASARLAGIHHGSATAVVAAAK